MSLLVVTSTLVESTDLEMWGQRSGCLCSTGRCSLLVMQMLILINAAEGLMNASAAVGRTCG